LLLFRLMKKGYCVNGRMIAKLSGLRNVYGGVLPNQHLRINLV